MEKNNIKQNYADLRIPKNKFGLLKAIKYGAFIGGINILIYLALYHISMDLIFSWWIQILINLFNIAFYILAALVIRKQNGGSLAFKKAFSVIFIILVVSGLLFIIFQYLQFNVAEPSLVAEYQETKVDQTVGMMERFEMKQEQIDKEVTHLKSVNPFGIDQLFWSFAMNSVLGGAVLSLIIAAFVKK